MRYVVSTRAAANGVMTGSRTVDMDPTVVVVTMSSDKFVGHTAKVPPGQPLPTGQFLTAVYDANTGELTETSRGMAGDGDAQRPGGPARIPGSTP